MFRLHPCDPDEESITMIEDQPLNTTDHGQLVDDTSLESGVMELGSNESISTEKPNQNQRFGPRDLMALLKSLEKEIDAYEVLLAEEIEKRKKYRVH